MVVKECEPVDDGYGPLRQACHSREETDEDFGERPHYHNQGSDSAEFVETFPAGLCRSGINNLL